MSSLYETKFDVIYRKLLEKKLNLKKQFDEAYSRDDFQASMAVMEDIQRVMKSLSSLETLEKPFKETARVAARIEDLRVDLEILLESLGKEVRNLDGLQDILRRDLPTEVEALLRMFREEDGRNFQFDFDKFSMDELMALMQFEKSYFPSRKEQFEEFQSRQVSTQGKPPEGYHEVNWSKELPVVAGVALAGTCLLEKDEAEEPQPEPEEVEEVIDHGVEDLSEFSRQNEVMPVHLQPVAAVVAEPVEQPAQDIAFSEPEAITTADVQAYAMEMSQQDEPAAAYHEAETGDAAYADNAYAEEEYAEGEYQEQYAEGEYSEGEYAEEQYAEASYADPAYAAEGEYAEGEYAEAAYTEEGAYGDYADPGYAEGTEAVEGSEYAGVDAYAAEEYSQEYAEDPGYAYGEDAGIADPSADYAATEAYADPAAYEADAVYTDEAAYAEPYAEAAYDEAYPQETGELDSAAYAEQYPVDEPAMDYPEAVEELSIESVDTLEPVSSDELQVESADLMISEEPAILDEAVDLSGSIELAEVSIESDGIDIDLDNVALDTSSGDESVKAGSEPSLDIDDIQIDLDNLG